MAKRANGNVENSSQIKAYKPVWAPSVGMLGVVKQEDGLIFATDIFHKKSLVLELMDLNGKMFDYVNMDNFKLSGNVCAVCVKGLKAGDFSYKYVADGVECEDIYRKNSTNFRTYGKTKDEVKDYATCYVNDYDWQGDCTLGLKYKDVIAYGLHVRGFTNHPSSKVKSKGKFMGVVEKIPYLTELGITQVVLMPCYDFYEWDLEIDALPKGHPKYAYVKDSSEIKKTKNYWGFKEAAYYMPKANYAEKDPVYEMKEMVRMLHKANIEVVMRFYFPPNFNRNNIMDILKFWVSDYHVDGFQLLGEDLPLDLIAANSSLVDTKIYYSYFDNDRILNMKCYHNRNLATFNNEFSNDCRHFLKSDENMLSAITFRMRNNPGDIHNINYITDYQGFTLNDLVSYDYKHNEDNGEDNTDGENFNYSWNCGVEGPTRKKNIINLRMRQIKNAFTLLLMSQGTPFILAGDEMLNSQNGNNNAYCQDNEVGYINWKNTKSSIEIFDYVKKLIQLRKMHPILHKEDELRSMDYISCGYPDISYHSDAAWYPRFDNHLRHIGICYCGMYALKNKVNEDDFFFICINMHWDSHEFSLVKLPKNLKWEVVLTSSSDEDNQKSPDDAIKSYSVGTLNTDVKNIDSILVGGRSIVILKSEKCNLKNDKIYMKEVIIK